MSVTNVAPSTALSNTILEYSINVAKKSKDLTTQQGQAALTLIDSASSITTNTGANAIARGTGISLDVIG